MTALHPHHTKLVGGHLVHCGMCGYDLKGQRWYGDGISVTVTCPGCGESWGSQDLHADAESTDSSYAWERVGALEREVERLNRRLSEQGKTIASQEDVIARLKAATGDDAVRLGAELEELRRQVKVLLEQLATERAAAVERVEVQDG